MNGRTPPIARNVRFPAKLSAGLALLALPAAPLPVLAAEPPAEVRSERPVPAPDRMDLRQQELFQQELARRDAARPVTDAAAGAEKFVPGSPRYLAGATLQLRPEVTVIGEEVRLRQICRWSDADKPAFEPVADLVLTRLAAQSPYRSVTFAELKQTLSDAGVNLGVIRLSGATACTIRRADAVRDERSPLDQWIDARQSGEATTQTAAAPRTSPTTQADDAVAAARTNPAPAVHSPAEPAANVASKVGETKAPDVVSAPSPDHTLRQLLLADLAERLSLKPDSLQVRFDTQDEKVLNLRQPLFRFNLTPRRVYNLGQVCWDVTLVADGPGGKNTTQKITIEANAKAWQEQVVAAKPMAWRQVVRDEDLIDRRTLIDRLSDDPIVTREQVVGQMAGRELRAGTVFTNRLVEAVPLVRPGQLVTVTVDQGGIRIKTAARAMEGGSYGQTIRVRNETTKDVFEVVCTGPQEAQMGALAAAEKSAETPARGKVATLDKD